MKIIILVASIVVLLDQGSKALIMSYLPYGSSQEIWPGVMYFSHVRNIGAAFGILPGQRLIFLLAAAIIVGAVVYFRADLIEAGPLAIWGSGLVVGGALGNLVDRIRFGYVVDFIDFRVWPVFNIADSAIVAGAILTAWAILRMDFK